MKLFQVEEGTDIKVIEQGEEWFRSNFENSEASKGLMFELHEMCVDPTGISDHACTPQDQVVGGKWAENGWYGFERDGYIALIPGDKVEVL